MKNLVIDATCYSIYKSFVLANDFFYSFGGSPKNTKTYQKKINIMIIEIKAFDYLVIPYFAKDMWKALKKGFFIWRGK